MDEEIEKVRKKFKKAFIDCPKGTEEALYIRLSYFNLGVKLMKEEFSQYLMKIKKEYELSNNLKEDIKRKINELNNAPIK